MTTLNIGKHLVPLEHIVLVEPFDPSTQTRMRTDKAYQTRVYLLDRETILAEEPLATFVEKHGFRRLSEDGIAADGIRAGWQDHTFLCCQTLSYAVRH